MHGAFDKETVFTELSHASQLADDDDAHPAASKTPAAALQIRVNVLGIIGVLGSLE